MSQIDAEASAAETSAENDAINENLKLVPVGESIRYRRRAQSAEKENETLVERLAQVRAENSEMARQLNEVRAEQKLTRKLAAAGAVDLEAAVVIARARIAESEDADLEEVVEQLKREKQYLFGGERASGARRQSAMPAKDRTQTAHTVLERAAKKAATTGNRADLQEYLKLRRNFI
jgi:hypothetical protein